MNEILGAIFGYNYKRRILINLRKKRKMLREKYLLKLKKKKEKQRKKKEQELIHRLIEKDKKELEEIPVEIAPIEEVPIEEEESTIEEEKIKVFPVKEIIPIKKEESNKKIIEIKDTKEEIIDLPKIEEDLIIKKEELLLIEKLDEKYNLPEDNMRDLIEEIMLSLDIVKVLTNKKELTEEDKEIVKDIKDDPLLDEIIEEDKKEIVITINDRTSSIEEVNDDFDKYKVELDYSLKKSKEEIEEIADTIDNKDLDVEVKREVIRKGIRSHTKFLLAANIFTRRRPTLRRVTTKLFLGSLIFDKIFPRRKVKIVKREVLPEEDLAAARKDLDYARLSILSYKKDLDKLFSDIEYFKDKEEYKESYDEIYKDLEKLFFELKNKEEELDDLERELSSSEEYVPEEEEIEYDTNNLGLYYLLRPRPVELKRSLTKNIIGHP